MACRSACKTKNHRTYGECARDAHIATQWLGGTGHSFSDEKAWARENQAYADARKDGLEPATVSRAAVNAAYEQAGG